jgi:hypothetical protein
MSRHQRELILRVSAVKSRRIASALAVVAGSGHPFTAMTAATPPQLGVHPRGAVASPGLRIYGLNLAGQFSVSLIALRRAGLVLIEGSTGEPLGTYQVGQSRLAARATARAQRRCSGRVT